MDRPVRHLQQRVHPHAAVDAFHARVPADGCACVISRRPAGGAVGHDQQVHFAQHGAGAANERRKDVTAHTRAILAPFCSRPRTQRARNKLEHQLAAM